MSGGNGGIDYAQINTVGLTMPGNIFIVGNDQKHRREKVEAGTAPGFLQRLGAFYDKDMLRLDVHGGRSRLSRFENQIQFFLLDGLAAEFAQGITCGDKLFKIHGFHSLFIIF
ncbi:hypothetical protein SDC9_91385 [bioreactor metagenome]|uniref:Uncharacterized protein n=1 Tax=bioreactor metagenome TaxID=1076179 RepID=A0A645A4K4_9ZZZZ